MEQSSFAIAWFVLIAFACLFVTLVVAFGLLGDRRVAKNLAVIGQTALRRCPRQGCHAANDAEAKFCRRCGSALPPQMLSRT